MSRPGIGSVVRAVGVAPCLVLGLALAPAAYATFTGSGQAATSYSVAVLPVPAAESFPVSASCTKLTGLFTVSITVTGTAAVQYANYEELIVRDPSGVVQFTGDLSSQLGRSYSTVTSNAAGHGNWTYEIYAKYKVPNSANVWTGQPLTRTLTCN